MKLNFKIHTTDVCYWLSIILILFYTTPILRRNKIREIIFLTILWFVFAAITIIKKQIISVNRLAIYTTIWLGYVFVLFIVGYSTAKAGSYFDSMLFFVCIYIAVFSNAYFDEKKKRRLTYYFTIVLLLNVIDNIILNFNYSNASTVVMTKTNLGDSYLNLNIGATEFSAMCMFSCFVYIDELFKCKNILKKVFCLVSYILCFYLIVFQHQRATASILLVTGTLAIVFANIKTIRNSSVRTKIILFIVVLLVIFLSVKPVVNLLAIIITSERLNRRFVALNNLLNGNLVITIAGNDLQQRIYLIIETLKTFLSSFKNTIIGTGYNLVPTDSVEEMINLTGVGYHSEIIDTLGAFGLIGGTLVYTILFNFTKMIVKCNFQDSSVVIIIAMFIIYAFLNPAFNSFLGVALGLFVMNKAVFLKRRI